MIVLESNNTDLQIAITYLGGREKPCLAIKDGNEYTELAQFHSTAAMNDFLGVMCLFFGDTLRSEVRRDG